jgi:hypothetical protein
MAADNRSYGMGGVMEDLTAGKPPEIAGALVAKRGKPEKTFSTTSTRAPT